MALGMASASSGSGHLGMTENQKRWLLAGIAVNKILMPQIRPFVEQGIKAEYIKLKASHNIDTQSTSGRLRWWPHVLKYENINGNDVHSKLPSGRSNYSLFDCRVTSHVDFARLYVQNFMAHFTAFDDHCDASAVLTLLGWVPAFSAAVQTAANDVREARNDWTHCVFSKWDQTKFARSFTEMEQLVRAMALQAADERKLLGELSDWETKGTYLCMNSPLDPVLIQLVQQEVKSLQDDAKNMSVEYDKERTKVQSELQNCAGMLEELLQRVERLETGQQNVEQRTRQTEDRLDDVENRVGELENQKSNKSKDRLRVWIDCDISEAAGVAGVFRAASSRNNGLPTPQEVLSLIALRTFQVTDPSTPEELNGFLQYLKEVRKVLVLDVQSGSLIITVKCGSLDILEGLWKDYCSGRLNEMAQKYLVTDDILKELGLTEVKLKANIKEEEYTACEEHFMRNFALLGLTINCSDITPAPDPQRGSSEIDRVSNGVYVTTQHVLNLAASMYLQTIDPSKPEDLNGFVRYLREVRNLLIVDAKPGSLIITVKCRSREILEHLWNDYCSGLVNEMAQKYLLSKEVLNELNLTEAKLATTIPEEEYRACQEQLLLYSVKKKRNELQYLFLHWARIRKRTRALLAEVKTQLSSIPGRAASIAAGAILGAVAAPLTFGISVVGGAFAGAIFGVFAPDPAVHRLKEQVHHAIDEDRKEGQELKAMIEEDVLGQSLAEFALFGRHHIDLVLSSKFVEDEFRFLLDILQRTRTIQHRAASQGEVPRSTLRHEEVNIHFERVSTFLEQLRQRFTSNQEALTITEQILDELQESPNDEEIERRIREFIETKFDEACTSQVE